ncbi:MAG: diguanylate cyclase/phosphodiesterase [Mycobacteriales bacterium]
MRGRRGATTPTDVQRATRRYLLYGLLPAWFVPGILDWAMHRRTRIEDTAGTRESLIHALMMGEVGAPIAAALLLEINPPVLALMAGAAVAHEATAAWDVRTADGSPREVRPTEQLIHSFLESLPFTALSVLACLHWDEVRELFRGDDPGRWKLRRKDPPLPAGYLAGVGAAVTALIAVPYGEELLRCVRAGRRRR